MSQPRLNEVRLRPAESAATDSRAAAVAFPEAHGLLSGPHRVLTGATVVIEHGLGRQLVGWRVVRCDTSPPELYETFGAPPDERRLSLTHTGPATTSFTLWVW